MLVMARLVRATHDLRSRKRKYGVAAAPFSQAQIMGHYGISPEGVSGKVLELLDA